jgi:hypothetical protein
MVDHCCLVPLNWMKGTFTGNHYVCWVKLWFLVYKFPGKNNLKCIHRFSKLSLVRRGAGLASRLLNFMEDKVRDWSQVRCAFLAFLMHFLWVFTKLYRYNSMYTRTGILFFCIQTIFVWMLLEPERLAKILHRSACQSGPGTCLGFAPNRPACTSR